MAVHGGDSSLVASLNDSSAFDIEAVLVQGAQIDTLEELAGKLEGVELVTLVEAQGVEEGRLGDVEAGGLGVRGHRGPVVVGFAGAAEGVDVHVGAGGEDTGQLGHVDAGSAVD